MREVAGETAKKLVFFGSRAFPPSLWTMGKHSKRPMSKLLGQPVLVKFRIDEEHDLIDLPGCIVNYFPATKRWHIKLDSCEFCRGMDRKCVDCNWYLNKSSMLKDVHFVTMPTNNMQRSSTSTFGRISGNDTTDYSRVIVIPDSEEEDQFDDGNGVGQGHAGIEEGGGDCDDNEDPNELRINNGTAHQSRGTSKPPTGGTTESAPTTDRDESLQCVGFEEKHGIRFGEVGLEFFVRGSWSVSLSPSPRPLLFLDTKGLEIRSQCSW